MQSIPAEPMDTSLPLLFRPLQMRGVTARNRIMVSPMCQYRSPGGAPTDWHLVHLGRLAIGGAGIVFGEETAVEARGRKTHSCAGLWDDAQIPAYRRITDFIRSQNGVPAIQLGHSGAKASTTRGPDGRWRRLTSADADEGRPPWVPLSPGGAAPEDAGLPVRTMDRDDIRAVQDAWVEAARRSLEAGFDMVEIHGAHGYLIHQFLSPVTNRRSDGYGGDRAGRMRFALELTEKVRAVWPSDRPLAFRVSSVDGRGGRWGLEDTLALCTALKQRGVDVVDCSSGGIAGDSTMPVVPWVAGHHVPYASAVRRATGLMTVAVGMITAPAHAEAILAGGHADIIALARELLVNGDWPVAAAGALGVADPFASLPPAYAYRLRRRERARQHELNRLDAAAARFPTSETDSIPMPQLRIQT